MTLYDDGWRPIQAKAATIGDTLLTPHYEEELITAIEQHPYVSRMLTLRTDDGGSYNYVKTAQVWIR